VVDVKNMSSLERIMKNRSAEPVGKLRAVSQVEPLTTKPKIMVVDDDEAICEMLTRFLAKRDTLSVIGFTNSKKALEHLKTHEVNLMLTDMAMPGLTGIELARNVKTLYPALPVIVMSGSADGQDRDEIFSLGADFIYKPFELVELLERVEAKCPAPTL
jgi:DNA-binding response OmpR family regulator